MQLNYDCIRDLLLYLEDNLTYDNYISIETLKLEKYSSDELIYTAERLTEAGYINSIISTSDDYPVIIVKSISFDGHQYLDTIRDNAIWKETKSKLSKTSSFSLSIIQQLALSIVKSKLGI